MVWLHTLGTFYLQDTNPIYLFSKMAIEAATPPSPSVHYGSGKYGEIQRRHRAYLIDIWH